MSPTRTANVAVERRRASGVGLAALAAVVLIIASKVVSQLALGVPDNDSELLREVDAHTGAQIAAGILQALGVGLLALPLLFLFRAAAARSDLVRTQLAGLVVAAPLFLSVLAILLAYSTISAASDWVSDEIPRLLDAGIPIDGARADELASEALTGAPLRGLAAGFGIGGQIGFAFAMFYTCLHAMRTGLLTRFWGSLGMALGAVSVFFFQLTVLWFIYAGLMFLITVPKGRPPAWGEGRAIPWPTPGERAAAELEAEPGSGDDAEPESTAAAPSESPGSATGEVPPEANGRGELR